MRQTYLIDGYNYLVPRMPQMTRRRHNLSTAGPALVNRLERARNGMLQWLAGLSIAPSVVVVFDARSHRQKPGSRHNRVEFGVLTVYATGYETADDLIVEMCQHRPAGVEMVVVSNDAAVRKSARRAKAKWMSCDEFEQLARSASAVAPAADKPPPRPSRPASAAIAAPTTTSIDRRAASMPTVKAKASTAASTAALTAAKTAAKAGGDTADRTTPADTGAGADSAAWLKIFRDELGMQAVDVSAAAARFDGPIPRSAPPVILSATTREANAGPPTGDASLDGGAHGPSAVHARRRAKESPVVPGKSTKRTNPRALPDPHAKVPVLPMDLGDFLRDMLTADLDGTDASP